MKRALSLAILTLVVAACGQPAPGTSTTIPPEPTTTLSLAPTTTVSVGEGVEVIVTASAVRQPDGSIELCPPGMTGACPGIILIGDIDPALLATDEETRYVQVTGHYDGLTLQPSSAPVAFEYGPAPTGEFASLCPELRGTPSVNPDDALTQALTSYASSQPDYAALWWDRESAVLTVWFKGDDVSAHQAAIAELAGEEPVCVAGGATYSEAELMEAADLLNGFTDSRGLPLATFGFGVGGLSNRIDLPLEEIDPETRSALDELVGNRVVAFPFIEMVDAPLSDLPDPVLAVVGDVDILTSRVRTGGGMDALGVFQVAYDPAQNCLYFSGSEEGDAGRTVPVWPFGYAATSEPFAIYDYDGNQVGGEGDTLELGGGFVGIEFVEGNTCGADGAWIVNR